MLAEQKQQLQLEVASFLQSKKSLMLASANLQGEPYASYAPFAIGDNCLYVQLSSMAIHADNVRARGEVSCLVIEDEAAAAQLYARQRISYRMTAVAITAGSTEWLAAVALMVARLGNMAKVTSELADFQLFRLEPKDGRYVKGFGQAYDFSGLFVTELRHLSGGHKKR